MVMTDVSDSTERANAIGKLGVSYGMGMVVGPIVGGYVTTLRSEQFAAGVAAGLCLIAIAVVLVFVPANTKHLQKVAMDTKENSKSGESRRNKGRGSNMSFYTQAVCLTLEPSFPY